MTIAYWHDDYTTGNDKVDQQHQNLFQIVNDLHNAMLAGQGKDIIKTTLDTLIQYTIEHFDTEERLMLVKQYPYYGEHKKAHEKLKNQVTVLAQKISDGKMVMNKEVLHFLNEWLIHHIKGEDKKMIDYFKNIKYQEEKNCNHKKKVFLRINKAQDILEKARISLRNK